MAAGLGAGRRAIAAGVIALAVAVATGIFIPGATPAAAQDGGADVPLPRPSPIHDGAVEGDDGQGDDVPADAVEALDDLGDPDATAPRAAAPEAALPFEAPAAAAPLPLLDGPAPAIDGFSLPKQAFVLEARLTEDGPPIPDGVTWRVFSEAEGPDGRLPLIAEASGGTVSLSLAPGDYFLHAAFGRAGATQRVTVSPRNLRETVVLNAGGLKLHALIGKEVPLTGPELRFDIFAGDGDASGERTLVVPEARPDQIIRLNSGTYHVVCRYGDTNAIVRADIEVKAGQLTDATLYQQAARITLKLVSDRGGEALANTAWTVIAPGGETVFSSVGAFPSVILAAGDYTAVAKHDGQTYQSPFKVEDALNRDIEVLAQ